MPVRNCPDNVGTDRCAFRSIEEMRAQAGQQNVACELAARVEGATPSGRDRYLDFLRVAAIIMVVFGHWVVRVVIAPEGEPEARYLLELQPGWQWATLIWQVMPLIFLVGGALNAESWRRARSDGMAPVGWIRHRAHRLLRPTLLLLLLVVPLWLAAELLAPGALLFAPGVALIPLWFVAAYLAIMALTPATMALHERGLSMPAIVLAVAIAGVADLLRLAELGPVLGTQRVVGLPNFLLIWAGSGHSPAVRANDSPARRRTRERRPLPQNRNAFARHTLVERRPPCRHFEETGLPSRSSAGQRGPCPAFRRPSARRSMPAKSGGMPSYSRAIRTGRSCRRCGRRS